MYPPPDKIIIDKLLNNELESIAYGRCSIHLSFSNGNLISFEAPYRFAKSNELLDSQILDFPTNSSPLMRLLGFHIKRVDCESDGTLTLYFSNDDILILYDDSPLYQAYLLKIEGKEYRI